MVVRSTSQPPFEASPPSYICPLIGDLDMRGRLQIPREMKIDEVFCNTFKVLRHELGHDRPRDSRPMWQQRQSADSDFCRALVANGYLSEAQMQHAAQRYRLGRSRDGGVIFWQIDTTGSIFDGKIMYYRPDCHRDHQRHPQWVSNRLKRYYLEDDAELMASIPSYHCLFGTHLLTGERLTVNGERLNNNHEPITLNPEPTVAVVEAEKTAVILSEHYPAYLWLAAGGLFELTADKLFPLRHHRVVLFPDTDPDLKAYTRWYEVAQETRRLYGCDISVSPLLEQRATPEQKQRKIDLVDYLFETQKHEE